VHCKEKKELNRLFIPWRHEITREEYIEKT